MKTHQAYADDNDDSSVPLPVLFSIFRISISVFIHRSSTLSTRVWYKVVRECPLSLSSASFACLFRLMANGRFTFSATNGENEFQVEFQA